MMRKYVILSFLLLLSIPFSAFPIETITITTYYPSPTGVYGELRSQRVAVGATYFDAAAHPWDTGGLLDPGEISQNADLVVEGDVGIGTTSPDYQLDIEKDASPTLRLHDLANGGASKLILSGNEGGTTDRGFGILYYDYVNNWRSFIGRGAHFVLGSAGTSMVFGKSTTLTEDIDGNFTPWMTLTGGNVGIGTTTPQRTLDVAGADGVRVAPSVLPASPAAGDIAIDSGDSNTLKWYDGTAWASAGGGNCYVDNFRYVTTKTQRNQGIEEITTCSIAGYTDRGPVGEYGACWYSGTTFSYYLPPRGKCDTGSYGHGADSPMYIGQAHLCCK